MSLSHAPLVRSRRRTLARYGAGVVAGVASFALVGCGSEETPVPAATSGPASTSAAAPPLETAAPSSAPPSASSSASASGDNRRALLAAAATAEDALSGTTVVSVEQDEESGETVWQVGVVTRDGDEQDVDVSADGSEVVRTGRVDRQDAADRRENRALVDDGEVDVADAVGALPARSTAAPWTSWSSTASGPGWCGRPTSWTPTGASTRSASTRAAGTS